MMGHSEAQMTRSTDTVQPGTYQFYIVVPQMNPRASSRPPCPYLPYILRSSLGLPPIVEHPQLCPAVAAVLLPSCSETWLLVSQRFLSCFSQSLADLLGIPSLASLQHHASTPGTTKKQMHHLVAGRAVKKETRTAAQISCAQGWQAVVL